jgi:sugar phosphate isomerase/epimerase
LKQIEENGEVESHLPDPVTKKTSRKNKGDIMSTSQLIFATAWGIIDSQGGKYPLEKLPSILEKLKALGYTGIEIPIVLVMQYGSKKFEALLKEKGMLAIAMIFSSGASPCGGPPTPGNLNVPSEFGIPHPVDPADGHDVETHCAIWEGQAKECLQIQSVLHAVTSHTGKDYYSNEEADKHFEFCTAFEKSTGLIVNHETHRARILYSPWVVSRILAAHPALHLCADLSHFSCVAESGPLEPEINKVVALLAPRVRHVHARVGFEEGPQILDPRLPNWKAYLEGYSTWWKIIFNHAKTRGDAVFSTTPEFGPPGYAWIDMKGATVSNVWSVNHYVGGICSKLHKEVFGQSEVNLQTDPDEGVWDM